MPKRQLDTFGGTNTATIFSGAVAPAVTGVPGGVAVGSDVLLFSGTGRLDGAFSHQNTLSGQPVIFYDGVTAVSGGPLSASGHVILGILDPTPVLVSGIGNLDRGGLVQFGSIFNSGLCVHTASGQPGFTASWTPLP